MFTAPPSFRHLISDTSCSSPTASMTSDDDVRTYPLTNLLAKQSTPTVVVPPEMKCQYKTGTCTNMRTTKKNGKLLMLCELHRRKQNEIKKRSDRKQSALRMSRRLEAKMKAAKEDSIASSEDENSLRRKFKRTSIDTPDAYPEKKLMAWNEQQHDVPPTLPALTLPRVNVWRTKDGIATANKMYPGYTQQQQHYSNEFTNLLSTQNYHQPPHEWSPRAPLPSLTPTGAVRGNDLAILEFFLHD
ncbi:hypothetical protein THRCLA_02164 [Thraustotheca clavata]|uniref:Uncharacterized protein n=1 Tax=Thraustotheca clavata TaxID=74557 RepID=A0A1W0A6U5_9STRA|nr:hypothetical protein THRCLA_02164 [Thraustotheca clavata]